MGMAMAVIRTGPTDRIDLISRTGPTDRIDQASSPNRIGPAFNLCPDPDHRQAWVVPPECREAVVARFGLDINTFNKP